MNGSLRQHGFCAADAASTVGVLIYGLLGGRISWTPSPSQTIQQRWQLHAHPVYEEKLGFLCCNEM